MNFVINWVENSGGVWLYSVVFLSALAENLFTPLPGDSVTVFGAYLAGMGKLSLMGVYICSTAGGTAGFMGLYFIGRLVQNHGARRGKLLTFSLGAVDKVAASFGKWGYIVILLNRFIYGIRFAVAIFAGMARLPWVKVLIYSAIGAALWNAILVYLGGMLGENWEQFKEILWEYNRVFLAGALLIVLAFAFWKIAPRWKKH